MAPQKIKRGEIWLKDKKKEKKQKNQKKFKEKKPYGGKDPASKR